jgi:type II secretory pathway component PulF
MSYHIDVFPESTISVIEAGEKSGKLVQVMKELVIQLRQKNSIQEKIKSIMIYPAVVGVFMLIAVVAVLLFVVPKFESIFGSVDELPGPTKVLIAGSDLIINYWFFLIAFVIFSVASLKMFFRTKNGETLWEYFLLNLPIIAPVYHLTILVKITRLLGFLLASGVELTEAVKITAIASGSGLFKDSLVLSADDLSKGIMISESLAGNDIYPKMFINLVSSGEKSASLDLAMKNAANFYSEDLERHVANLSKLIEPIILIVISGMAIFIIMAIYLPILKLNDAIGG